MLPDLNLVRTFLHLYETRSVTQTAERLTVTQPSVSHALSRLRRDLNDQLFNRSTGGLRATQRADDLYPLMRQALDVIDASVDELATFSPETSQRTFTLLATDLGEISLLPALLARVTQQAPHVTLHVGPLDIRDAPDALRQGQADAVICTPRITAPDIDRDVLFDDSYCGISALDHPRVRGNPTLQQFQAERHIAVVESIGHGDADHALERLGLSRDIGLRISHFAALPQLVERTGHLAIITRTVSNHFCAAARITPFALPFEVPPVQIAAYTYRRRLPDPGVQWLRQTIREALTDWTS
ncbi:LysR family transcriptional regulator [Janibacter sp. GS2]|uniref:LysR family transcriptional regulator n=1 Tax=Janibacter sp. GS2 TaxID=3442646 RepID=UPI003EC11574